MSFEIPQTTVSQFPAIGLEGQLADSGFHDITAGIVGTALDCGRLICLGDDGYQSVKPIASSADVPFVKGFSLYRAMIEPNSPRFPAGVAIDILRVGRIYVVAQGDLTDEGPVFVVHAGANAGLLRADVGSGGNAATAFTRAKVIKGGSAGALCIVSINLP